MDPLRVLVAEDEPQQRARLVRFLDARDDVTVVAEAATGPAALAAIRAHRPDLVLLDVEMPEMNGLDVLEALGPTETPAVVFVTAYAEHAVRAFELHAADYLLKPFDDTRLDAVLTRAFHNVRLGRVEALSRELMRLLGELKTSPGAAGPAGDAPVAPAAASYLERLGIRVGGKMVLLRTHEIDHVAGAGVYVEVHAGKRRYHLRSTLSALEGRLDPATFVRIHRSTIVNVNRVRELVPHLHGEYVVILEDGTQLKLSRGYRDRLVALMGEMG